LRKLFFKIISYLDNRKNSGQSKEKYFVDDLRQNWMVKEKFVKKLKAKNLVNTKWVY